MTGRYPYCAALVPSIQLHSSLPKQPTEHSRASLQSSSLLPKYSLVRYVIALLVQIVLVDKTCELRSQDVWATAYYAGWMQGWNNNGHLPAEDIDYTAVTHIIHFGLVPRPDGTLDSTSNSITVVNSRELLTRAHAAGKKVLICVGGWATDSAFLRATSTVNLPFFVANLISFLTTRGYDGIDIDWEPLNLLDAAQYIAFVTALRAGLDLITPRPLLTAANGTEGEIFAQIHQLFDQINLMTYDMAGPWPGWVTWHNAPIYDGGYTFPCCPWRLVPSADGYVDDFIAAGVPAAKIGIGIDFYGYVWSGGDGTPTGGVSVPRQIWTVPPFVRGNVPYYTLMENYFQPELYRWDDTAHAAYLSIDSVGSPGDKFISYDNQTTVHRKIHYARTKSIGGVIIWELGGGYRPLLPVGHRDSLLQAVKEALTASGNPKPEMPKTYALAQNFPNPFNSSTMIQYAVPEESFITLDVFNILGQHVQTLIKRIQPRGYHRVRFNASLLPSGVYFYRLTAHPTSSNQTLSFTESRKFIHLK